MDNRWSLIYQEGVYSSPEKNVYFLAGNCWDFSRAVEKECHYIEAEEVTAIV